MGIVWPDLTHRDPHRPEHMDDPHCDPLRLHRTYAQFGAVNTLVSSWRAVYLHELRPLLSQSKTFTLLDIGCGGGDVPLKLLRWAARDGFELDITAIDADSRAIDYACSSSRTSSQPSSQPRLRFRQALSSDLVLEGERFDFVISNHLLHHLRTPELFGVLRDSEALCRIKTVHSDLERAGLAYAAFKLLATPFFRNSFIVEDGLSSIRRSYTAAELRGLVPPHWRVKRQVPFHTLLTLNKSDHA